MGQQLRSIRQSRGMTLRAAASASGLSASFIGQVERGETEIAVSRLVSLADAYEVDFVDLFSVSTPPADFVPFDQTVKVDMDAPGVDVYHVLEPNWSVHPFIVRMNPRTRMVGLRHRAEEFIHCVQGTPTMKVGSVIHQMSPGDTLWVRQSVEHEYVNDTASPAALIGAYVPWCGSGSCPYRARTSDIARVFGPRTPQLP